jgi:hypothetical protein
MLRMLLIALILGLVISACCKEDIRIDVKKTILIDISKYRSATIIVNELQHGSQMKYTASEADRDYIQSEIFAILSHFGLTVAYKRPEDVGLKVDCQFRRSLGCLHIGRHFNIEFEHISFINIKVVDVKAGEVIGEVECIRPTWKRLPPQSIKLMFDEMIKPNPAKREPKRSSGQDRPA